MIDFECGNKLMVSNAFEDDNEKKVEPDNGIKVKVTTNTFLGTIQIELKCSSKMAFNHSVYFSMRLVRCNRHGDNERL